MVVLVQLRFRPVLLTFLLAVAAVAPVGAQDAALPGTTWFVHHFEDPYGEGAFLNFLPPTDEEDQTATGDPSPDPLVITIPEAAASAVPYAAVGTAGEALVWVKGFNNAPSPGTKVTVEVLAGAASLAKASVTHDILNPTASIVEFRIPLTVTATSIPAGDKVSMVVTIENDACGCFTSLGYPRGVSPDHAWQVRLPFVQVTPPAAGGATAHRTDANATFHQAFSSTNATTASYHTNWTAGPASADVTLTLDAQAGSLSVRVVDAANKTLVDAANATAPLSLRVDGTAGTWRVLVSLHGFKGNATLVIAPAASPASTDSGTAPASPTATGTGSSAASTSGTSNGTPGLPLGLLLAALGAALWVRRHG